MICDDDVVLVAQHELLFAVDAESDDYLALWKEVNLGDLFQLVVQRGVVLDAAGLQLGQEFLHETAVELVLPTVEVALEEPVALFENEELAVALQEFLEEEHVVKLILDFLGNLLKNLDVLLHFQGLIFIILPLILKMILYLLFELPINRIIVIKLLAHAKEVRQLVSLVKRLIELLYQEHHADELVHDGREYCDATQHDEGTHDALYVAPGHKVAEAHRRQRSECKVDCHDRQFLVRGILEPVVLVVEEGVHVVRVVEQLAEEDPEEAEEVAAVDHVDYQFH